MICRGLSQEGLRHLIKKVAERVEEKIGIRIKEIVEENKKLKEENKRLEDLIKDMADDIQRARQSGYELGLNTPKGLM